MNPTRLQPILGVALIVLGSVACLAEEGEGEEGGGATTLGIASFSVDKAEIIEAENLLRVTLSYDATICGNPWSGGIFGYGEIERLRECRAKAHFYEESDHDRAMALASTAETWTGFSVIGTRLIYENAPEGTTHMVSWDDATLRFDETSPLSGSADLDIELPSFMKYLKEKRTYHIVVIGDIQYDAFNGGWWNIAGLGPVTFEIGEDVDELLLRVDGPDEIEAGGGKYTFTLDASGKEATIGKVDRVTWTFAYLAKEGWTELDPINEDRLSNLEIPAEVLRTWWSLAIRHGTLRSQRYVLSMRAKAEAYAQGELLATSNNPSFAVTAVEELKLTVDGPETVDSQAQHTTFSLSVEGEDETKSKVDEVLWVFSHPDAEGKWTNYYQHREQTLVDLKLSQGSGGVSDYWYDLVLRNGESVAGTKRLEMRLIAQARTGSRTIGESPPHSFWLTAKGLEIETNLSSSYDVYPTMPTLSTIEIHYDGEKPIRLDVVGTIPAYIEISFNPQVIEPEEGEEGIYHSNISVAFDAAKAPGISLPNGAKMKVAIEGMDVKYEKDISLKLLKAEWVVMIYMAMDTRPDLLLAALDYMGTLTKVFRSKGNPQVGVVILLDTIRGNEASMFSYEKGERISRTIRKWGPTNMSDARTLKRFVEESRQVMPASRYLLMIDAHGGGIRGVVYDENQGGSKHPMKFQPMLDALKAMPIEIIAFNSCLMAQTEVLHHISSLAPYLVASELIMPGTGLDLKGLFTALFADPSIASEEVAKLLVTQYKQRHVTYFRRNTTLSCIRSDKLAALASAVDTLAKELLKGYKAKDAAYNRTVADIGSKTEMVNGGYPYADIKDFAERVAADARLTDQTLKAAASRVVKAVDDAVVSEAENVWVADMKLLKLVQTSENGYNGLSALLWNYRIKGDEGKVFRNFISHYDQTAFSRATAWGEFLQQYARSVPRTTRAVHLTHLLHELHLHVYDQDGSHVGYNSSSTDRTPIDCEISGALYSDMGNGTKIILLPESVTDFTVVVDGHDMEEPEEPYTLTMTLVVDGEVVDVHSSEMTIRENTSHSAAVVVDGESLEVGETVVEGDVAGELPEWFRESFLLPLVRPILPLVPDPLIPVVPYLVIGIPLLILLLIGIVAARSRRRNTIPSHES
jgi:hypothetical protein